MRGFTNRIITYLAQRRKLKKSGDIFRATITSSELLTISRMIPEDNFHDRQNNAPSFNDFLQSATLCGKCLYDIYIVPSSRIDERVTIDGAWIPANRGDVLAFLINKALEKPEEMYHTRGYIRVWWD